MAQTVPNIPEPREVDAILDQFEGWNDFPVADGLAELKSLMVERLREPARYVLAGREYMEAGVVLRGDSEKTGNKRDDRAIVLLQLGRMLLPTRDDSWTDVTVCVDDGTHIGKIELHGRASGERRVETGDFSQTPKLYQRLHTAIEAGKLIGHWQWARYPFERWRTAAVRKQAARILGTCAVDAELTNRYLDADVVRKRAYNVKPVSQSTLIAQE